MKVVILARGMGIRLAEDIDLRPKPMVDIVRRPILWRITQHYFSSYGLSEFIIRLVSKGDFIKRYLLEYAPLAGDFNVKLYRCRHPA